MIKVDYQRDYRPEGLPLVMDEREIMVRPWGIVVADQKYAWASIEAAGRTESMITPVLQISAALPHLIEMYGTPAIQMLVHNVTLAIDKQYMSIGQKIVQEEWSDQVRHVAELHKQYSDLAYVPPEEIPNYSGLVFMNTGDFVEVN